MSKNIQCLAVRSDFMTDEMKHSIISRYEQLFAGFDIILSDEISKSYECYFILGGGTENQINSRYKEGVKEQVILLAHSENNSLPAALELMAALKQKGIMGQIAFLTGDKRKDRRVLGEVIEGYSVWKRLSQARIGMIGEPSDWLVASSPSKALVTKKWGVNLVDIPIEELIDYESIEHPEMDAKIEKIKQIAGAVIEPDDEDLSGALKVYNRLQKLVIDYQLDAVTVKCFELLERTGITGCYALSQLNDRRIIAGCEGDIISILTMLWSYYLTDSLPWMGNPSYIDKESNEIIIAHCTVPSSLIVHQEIRSHFESGKSVAIAGEMVKGAVTLLRIGGKNLSKIWCEEGRIVENLSNPNHCRTQIKIKVNSDSNVKELLTNPLGNHLIVLYGNYKEQLKQWFNFYIGERDE